MLRIRLSRVGKKKQPAYRIVVADSRAPRRGSFVEIIGHYNPLTDPATLVVKEEKAVDWLKKGAQPSETAAKLLTRLGVMEKAGKEPFVYKAGAVAPKPKKRAAAQPPAAAAAPAPAAAEEAAAEPAPPEAEPEPQGESQDQPQEQAEQAEPTE